MFDDLLNMKAAVDKFLTEAAELLKEVKAACDALAAESKELKERIMELHGAHETILGFIADCDEEAEEEITRVNTEAAATAAAAAETAVAAAATVEAAAETVAAAVEEHSPPEGETPVTETPAPVETPPAETPPATPPAETPPVETPVPAESATPAVGVGVRVSEAPTKTRKRFFI